MTDIEVIAGARDTYHVTVTEVTGSSHHAVTATPDDVARFGGDAPPEVLLNASFRFLLDREPKEAILGTFDLPVIARYFPDYTEAIGGYLP